ncbi:MAG: hypothetical protein DRH15_05235, partial [Deltaproteobacteria bacterium]
GFTLLELLVTLILVSIVVLIVAMALRLTIKAWERGQKEGGCLQAGIVVPLLLDRQIRFCTKKAPFSVNGPPRPLFFTGTSAALTFFTTYSQMGTAANGLLRVCYLYSEEEKTLKYYQKIVTRPEDLSDKFNPLSGQQEEGIRPVSTLRCVSQFKLAYSSKSDPRPKADEDWQRQWKRQGPRWPGSIRLKLKVRGEPQEMMWIFHP